jgi:hypothetical protein
MGGKGCAEIESGSLEQGGLRIQDERERLPSHAGRARRQPENWAEKARGYMVGNCVELAVLCGLCGRIKDPFRVQQPLGFRGNVA